MDLGTVSDKIERYKLGMRLAKAGLSEGLHRFIERVDCDDARLTIVFNSIVAKFEFEHSKDQVLDRCRDFFRLHSKEFKGIGFLPTKIEAKVQEIKENIVFDPFLKPTPRNARKKIATSDFENKAKSPAVYAGFENIRKIMRDQGL
ncbi:hypothetical protein [Campylobacter fetus]|uniref:hypothetical protein n=1 Tax=Campylobacter fetus TaxID=196 RepID=UPI00073A8800|nr:hypothetical protein [Campylobacter fetus]ALV64626.1 hypothetical protein CFTSP3_0657 [Campylobacter fetus subsp. testudinum Sp3]OCR92549.1 hypothetical protein CFT12S02263_05230 [Campylobacter fetus subsp. testudinum]